MMQFFGSTAGNVSPLNAEGIDNTVFIFAVVVSLVIASNWGFPTSSSTSFSLSLVSIFWYLSKNGSFFLNDFSMLFKFSVMFEISLNRSLLSFKIIIAPTILRFFSHDRRRMQIVEFLLA